MEFLEEYLVALIVAICLLIGFIIKHSLDFIPNKYIPLILGLLGVFLNIWLNEWMISPQILLGGLASGLASTGAHQLFTNLGDGG